MKITVDDLRSAFHAGNQYHRTTGDADFTYWFKGSPRFTCKTCKTNLLDVEDHDCEMVCLTKKREKLIDELEATEKRSHDLYTEIGDIGAQLEACRLKKSEKSDFAVNDLVEYCAGGEVCIALWDHCNRTYDTARSSATIDVKSNHKFTIIENGLDGYNDAWWILWYVVAGDLRYIRVRDEFLKKNFKKVVTP